MSSIKRVVLTGSTGGLGSAVLRHILSLLPPDKLIVSLYNPSKAPAFVSEKGIEVRRGDYAKPETLDSAFAGGEILLLVSYPSIAHELRVRNHINAIDAAKRVGIKHIFYTSLAFAGGPESSESVAAVMRAHIDTEAYLKQSGLQYTIIREGIYSESYPLYLGFFDASSGQDEVAIPDDGHGKIAWVSRDELGEGTARLTAQAATNDPRASQFVNKTILFSGPEAITLLDLARTISTILGRQIRVKEVDVETYATSSAALSRLGPEFARLWATTYEALRRGECSVVDPLLEEVIGRKPKSMEAVLKEILKDVTSSQESINQYAK